MPVDTDLLANFFRANDGLVYTRQLRANGFSHYQLTSLIREGRVSKVKRGLYKWCTDDGSELPEVTRIVPRGVCCLLTAGSYYNLTTFVASAYHLAIPRKDKISLPVYPPIKLYYWDATAYQLGQTVVLVDGMALPMYDLEKTVCDFQRQRHKLGPDLAKEVLTTYLSRPDRRISRLVAYAGQLGLGQYLDTTLTVLL